MIFRNKSLFLKLNLDKYCENINKKYLDIIINDSKNKIIFHCIDNKINIDNITSFIIYRKIHMKDKNKNIILVIGVYHELRKCGYGKYILDEFIKIIKKTKTNKKIYIIIHSLESSLLFFINLGFEKIEKCRFLQNYEGWTNELNHEKLIYIKKIENIF